MQIGLFVVLSSSFLTQLSSTVGDLQDWIVNCSGWYFALMVNTILGHLAFLLISRFVGVRLGGQDARPYFGRLSWLALLRDYTMSQRSLTAGTHTLAFVFDGASEGILRPEIGIDFVWVQRIQ